MRQCIALAAAACLLASGCANSGLFARKGCSQPCHVATSRNAPRPLIFRNACQQCGLFDKCDEPACGCGDQCSGDQCCGDGSCGPGGSRGTCNGRCRGLVDGIASGFCGPGCNGCADGYGNGFGNGQCNGCCGLCPNAGVYPEVPRFSPGPPTGQVAYPYYTTRGPRDFLACKPTPIGPH